MKLLLLTVYMTMVVTINCRGHWRPDSTVKPRNDSRLDSKISRDSGLGPPISVEEMITANANSNLTKPHSGEDHSIENSGEFEGDIILTPEQQAQLENGVRSATLLYQKWDNGILPYTISSEYTSAERQVIAKAIFEIQDHTCLKFIGRTTEQDYIEIFSGSACWSSVGRVGGKQKLSLKRSGCVSVGTAIHEFMHAAGFWHEQSRHDRDDYVTIHLENVKDGKEHNFNKYTTSTTTDLGLKYDYSSIMHYGTHYFSKNGKPTITPKKAGVTIGQRDVASKLDILGLNLLYNCKGCFDGVIIAGQCLTFSTDKLSWNAAKERCSSQEGRLATLNDPEAVKTYVVNTYGYQQLWVGGSDIAKEGSWVWENGQPFGNQFPWYQGEPNNSGNEDCLEFAQWGNQIYFNDLPCRKHLKYICEKVE